jgi:hypothetical protein
MPSVVRAFAENQPLRVIVAVSASTISGGLSLSDLAGTWRSRVTAMIAAPMAMTALIADENSC